MFRKPKRNIRQRKVTTDSEDEDENHEYAAKPAPAIQEEKALKKRLSPNGAGGMSYGFAEDEEEAVNLKEIQSNILKFKQSKNFHINQFVKKFKYLQTRTKFFPNPDVFK